MINGESRRMLIGQYKSKTSISGRVAFPKIFRLEMGDDLIVTVGYEKSLMVVSKNNWDEVVKPLESKPFIDNSTRDTYRYLLGQAFEVTLDDQGRFVLPDYMREYTEMKSEAIFLGLGKYVEVWSREEWKIHQTFLIKNSSVIAEKLLIP